MANLNSHNQPLTPAPAYRTGRLSLKTGRGSRPSPPPLPTLPAGRQAAQAGSPAGRGEIVARQSRKAKKMSGFKEHTIAVTAGETALSPHVLDLKLTKMRGTALVAASPAVKTPKRKFAFHIKTPSFAFHAPSFSLGDRIIAARLGLRTLGDRVSAYRLPKITLPRFAPMRIPVLHISLPFRSEFSRALAAFLVVATLAVAPLQALDAWDALLGAREAAAKGAPQIASSLAKGAKGASAHNVAQVSSSLSAIRDSLHEISAYLRRAPVSAAVLRVVPGVGSKVRAADAILLASKELTSAGLILTREIGEGESGDAVPARIASVRVALERALPHLERASAHLADLPQNQIPAEFQEKLASANVLLPALTADLRDLTLFGKSFEALLGNERPQRILLLFQNNAELRPTGGFIGSMALLTVRDGKIISTEVPGGGPYDYLGQLTAYVTAPEPLQLLHSRWEIQDANWFPDFPASAKKFLWFYERAGGPSVDAVVAIDAHLIEELLRIVGPVEIPEYGVAVTAENFMRETLEQVEVKYDAKENRPKKFIGAMMHPLLEKLSTLAPEELLRVAALLLTSRDERHMQIFATDLRLQENFAAHGWSGSVREAAGDYLMVVHANIGALKTDAVMENAVGHAAEIAEDGAITARVTVSRTHHGIAGDPFTGILNVDYVRIYVPEGSELLSAQGAAFPPEHLFEGPETWYERDPHLAEIEQGVRHDDKTGTRIWNEFGKTVFGTWMMTEPGKSSTVTFTYRLPFRAFEARESAIEKIFGKETLARYTLLMQKQAGTDTTKFRSVIRLPERFAVIEQKPEGQGLVFESNLQTDEAFGFAAKR